MLSNENCGGGKKQEVGERFRVMVFVFPLLHATLLSWMWLNPCPPMGSGEWVPCFAFHVCTAFTLSIQLFLSQSTFSLSILIFSFVPLGRDELGSVWGCVCWPGLDHTHLYKNLSIYSLSEYIDFSLFSTAL